MANSGTVKTNAYEGRYLLFSWTLTSQNLKANTSTIAWTLKGAGTGQTTRYKAGNFKVILDNTVVYSTSEDARIWLSDGTVVASGSYSFTHNAKGQKTFSVAIQGAIYYYAVNCTGSGSFALPTISRVSVINSVTGNNTDGNLRVSYTKYVSSYTDNLLIYLESTLIQTVNGYVNNKDITLSSGALSKIYAATGTSKTTTLTFKLQTYDGSTLLGTSDGVNETLNISNSAPTIGAISYYDSNSTTIEITGDNKYIIRNNSTLTVKVDGLTALNGSALKTLTVSGGGIDKAITLTGSSVESQTIDLGKVNQSADFTLTATLTDSRGFTTTKSVSVSIYDWILPTALISTQRVDNYYSETNVNITPNFSSLGGKNSITITARYKKTTDSSYVPDVTMQAGDNTLDLDNNYAWDLQISIKDKLGTTTYNSTVGRGLPIWFVDRVLNSIGVNCFPKESESLEVSGVNILKALTYASGDTITINSLVTCALITTDAKKLRFSIPLAKSYAGLTPSFTSLQMYLRSTSGIMTQYEQVVGNSEFTITPIKTSDNILTVDIDKTTAYSGVNSDTPVVVSVYATITFNTP